MRAASSSHRAITRADIDVDDLERELTEFRDVVDGWRREQLARERRIDDARSHRRRLLERERDGLLRREQELIAKQSEHAAEATRIELEMEQSREEAERARELAEGLPERLAREREALRNERSTLEREEGKVVGTSAMAKLDALREAREMYAERLGLWFEYGQGERLRLRFKYVDARAPEKEFVLAVRLRGSAYEVVECEPAIEMIESLARECNRSNDFGKFVRDVRRAFVALANGTIAMDDADPGSPTMVETRRSTRSSRM